MPRPRFEILASEATPIGELCLRRRGLLQDPGAEVTEITLDHELLMSSLNTASERRLASEAIDWHGGDGLRAWVGGLGLGYTARELLRSPRVASVRVVEFLPAVVGWLEAGLLPEAAALHADPRLEVVTGDAFARLEDAPGAQGRYDLLLIDIDHAPDERLDGRSRSFYERAGLARARAHLAPGGVLGVWSYAPSPRFAGALREVFEEVREVPVAFENPLVHEQETDWLLLARGAGSAR